jgi:methionyl-tRNA formyltransferase
MEGSVAKYPLVKNLLWDSDDYTDGKKAESAPGPGGMRIVVLTTGAVRRRYFVQALQAAVPIARVFVETRDPVPPFPVDHPSDAARKAHERQAFFDDSPPPFDTIASIESFHSLNEPEALAAIKAIRPDVMLVFGTGRLSDQVVGLAPEGCINFHNGDSAEYRGLDCHLWPIYHRDFDALKVTLHRVAPELDTGDLIDRRPVPLRPGMKLAELRRAATELTVDMALAALGNFATHGIFDATPQSRRGRYYSFMPAVLKDLCVGHFERFSAKL